MPRSTGEARVCKVMSSICEEYERHPLFHPSAQELCAVYGGLIAHDQSESELGEAEQLMRDTLAKHRAQLRNQMAWHHPARSLDEALVFVCGQALERLEQMRRLGRVSRPFLRQGP